MTNTYSGGIGKRIARYRKAAGYKTAADLAEIMQGSRLSLSVLYNIESGRTKDPSFSQILEIANALEISPIFLIADIEHPEQKIDTANVSGNLTEMTFFELIETLRVPPAAQQESELSKYLQDVLNSITELKGIQAFLVAVTEILNDKSKISSFQKNGIDSEQLEAQLNRSKVTAAANLRKLEGWGLDTTWFDSNLINNSQDIEVTVVDGWDKSLAEKLFSDQV